MRVRPHPFFALPFFALPRSGPAERRARNIVCRRNIGPLELSLRNIGPERFWPAQCLATKVTMEPSSACGSSLVSLGQNAAMANS
jgi:hypothetical protein